MLNGVLRHSHVAGCQIVYSSIANRTRSFRLLRGITFTDQKLIKQVGGVITFGDRAESFFRFFFFGCDPSASELLLCFWRVIVQSHYTILMKDSSVQFLPYVYDVCVFPLLSLLVVQHFQPPQVAHLLEPPLHFPSCVFVCVSLIHLYSCVSSSCVSPTR